MEKDLNNSTNQNSSPKSEEDSEKTFVGKFKSIITNTPLSKWFRKIDSTTKSTVRRRNDDAEDDEIQLMQPPSKRVKLPSTEENNHFSSLAFKKTLESTHTDVNQTSQTFNPFPEPVAGPSGIKTRKLLSNIFTSVSKSGVRNTFSSNEVLNGHKDSDSEESTSGYSSVPRIGSKDNVCQSQESSKQTSPTQNLNNSRSLFQNPNTSIDRSLFTEMSSSPKRNTSMTTRRPSFNASTFGSPNFIDKTITTEKIINSPFYNGKTIYGGASAYGRKLGRSARDLRSSLKRSVQIKPVEKTGESGNLTLGKTARRILETLEQYSSPVNDAKKIPVASKRFKSDGLLSAHVGGSLRSPKGYSPSKKELQVPTVSDLLKMKQKTKLQNSTETVRHIAISSKSNLNVEQNIFSQQKPAEKPETVPAKPQQEKDKLTAEPVKFNFTSLPTTTLPKFDFFKPPPVEKPKETPSKVTPPQTPIVSTTPKATVETETSVQKKYNDTSLFKFSFPLVISENMKSVVAINNFKFSEPIDNLKKADNSTQNVSGKWNSSSFLPVSSPVNVNEKTASPIVVKSVNQWECPVCLVKNNEKDSKCVCCTASKPSKPPATKTNTPSNNIPSSFGDKFKLPTSMWECSVCMVRNENSKAKCSACETPNPKAASNNTASNNTSVMSKLQPPPNNTSLMSKFQPPASTWECSSCLIRNKNEVARCVACESPRTGAPMVSNSFSASFKKKDDEWECQVCMVKNKITNVKCQCCESLKPGSSSNSTVEGSAKQSIPKFNFGIDKAVAASFSFGVPPSTTTQELPKPAVDPGVVFGDSAKKTTPAASFTFGVKPEQTTKTSPLVPPKTTESKDEVKKSTDKTDAPVPVPSFKFGSVTATTTQSTLLTNNKVESVTKTAPIAASTTTNVVEASKPTFNFSVAPSSGDKASTKADTPAKDPVKLFSFGSKPIATAAASVNSTQSISASPAPVVVTSQTTMPKPSFSFGVNKTSADSSSSLIFGAKPATAAATTNSFSATFGSPKASLTPTLPANSDVKASASVPSFKSTDNSFSFSSIASSSEPVSKAPVFAFGQSSRSVTAPRTAQPVAPSTGFGGAFGATNSSAPSFNFAAPKKAEVPASNVFGSGGMGNADTGSSKMFSFGAGSQNNNAQKAGFSFGGAVDSKPAPASAMGQTGFNFGPAASTPKSAAGGFNFSAVPSFDANVKPSFNFSDTPVTAFSAQPVAESGLPPQRKIRRAIRRTQR